MDELAKLPTEHSRQFIRRLADELELTECTVTVTEGSTKGENFFGDVYKVKVAGRRRGDGSSDADAASLVLKFASRDVAFRECAPVDRYYLREIAAYSEILPAFHRLQDTFSLPPDTTFKSARCRTYDSEPMQEMVAMDDLSVDGFRLYDRLVSLDYDHVALTVKSLASYHALSFVMRQKDPERFKKLAESACHGLDYGVHLKKFVDCNNKVLLKLFDGSEYYEKLRDYLSDAHEKLEKFTDPTRTEPYNVICHGDCWTSNLLFKYENEKVIDVRMVDWQVIRLASPVTDIGYIMFTSVDEAWRNRYFFPILDLYYDTLKWNITMMGCDMDKCYPKGVFNQHVKSVLPFGLLFGIVACPVTLCDRDTPITTLAAENEKITGEGEYAFSFSKTPAERLMGGVRDMFKFNLLNQ